MEEVNATADNSQTIALPAHQDLQERLGNLVMMVHQENLESLETTETPMVKTEVAVVSNAQLDHLDHLDQMEAPDHLGLTEILELLEVVLGRHLLVLLDHQEMQDNLAMMVNLELLAHLERLELKEQDCPDLPVHQDHWDHLDNQVQTEMLLEQALQDHLGHLDQTEIQGSQDLLEHQVLLVRMPHLAKMRNTALALHEVVMEASLAEEVTTTMERAPLDHQDTRDGEPVVVSSPRNVLW